MEFYISFGQTHTHRIYGQTYDCDSLWRIEAPNEHEARQYVHSVIGNKWSDIYNEKDVNQFLKYYPRGIIN